VATDDARAVRHDRVVICNTDAAWEMRGKLVQKLQMSCEVKCAPRVQDGCQKRILWQRRERCRCSWCSLDVIGDLEAVITLIAIGGPLSIGSSSRGRCNIDDGVRRCRAHCVCSLRGRSGDRDSCKVSFVLASLTTPVILLPCVSALVAGSFPIFGSFGSIAVVNGVTGSLMEGAERVHVLGVCGSALLCSIMLRNSCTVVVLWLLL